MPTSTSTLRIQGLTLLDKNELQELLGRESVQWETQPSQHGVSHELATGAAIVLLTLAAIKTIAVWGVGRREIVKIERTTREVSPDGTERITTEKFGLYLKDTSEENIREMGEMLKIDVKPLISSLNRHESDQEIDS